MCLPFVMQRININDKNDLITNDMTFSFTETDTDTTTYCSSNLSKTNHHSKYCGFYTFVSSNQTREKHILIVHIRCEKKQILETSITQMENAKTDTLKCR